MTIVHQLTHSNTEHIIYPIGIFTLTAIAAALDAFGNSKQ